MLVSIVIVFVLITLSVFWYFYELNVERTEDAQVNGNVVQVTAQIDGTVIAIHADDTDHVKAGTPLVRLNPVDQEIIYERARAALAKATRSVRSLYLQVSEAKADLVQRQADVKKAKTDLARRMRIASVGLSLVRRSAMPKTLLKALLLLRTQLSRFFLSVWLGG
ncbi:hypothetical protein ACNUIP_21870 [Pseudomonas aeruginosa]